MRLPKLRGGWGYRHRRWRKVASGVAGDGVSVRSKKLKWSSEFRTLNGGVDGAASGYLRRVGVDRWRERERGRGTEREIKRERAKRERGEDAVEEKGGENNDRRER